MHPVDHHRLHAPITSLRGIPASPPFPLEWSVNKCLKMALVHDLHWPSRHCLNPCTLSSTIDYTP